MKALPLEQEKPIAKNTEKVFKQVFGKKSEGITKNSKTKSKGNQRVY